MGIISSRSRKPTTEDYIRHIPKLHFVSATTSNRPEGKGEQPDDEEAEQQPDEDDAASEQEEEARKSNFSSLAQFAQVRS
ncbi:hypothetical protein BASA81_008556 [Batrachochytrium salamandrivorans]|nr:hypothetical protein BASA81_008556 [Batrachochytrium salamandrivorans]